MTRRVFLAQAGSAAAVRQGRDDDAVRLIEEQTRSGQVAGVSLLIRRGSDVLQQSFGKTKNNDAVFLLASISKPMTATCVMVLADRKELSLSDPVQRFIPEFRGDGREAVLIRHLLTHTSGLPDMLPQDVELRKAHAPLSAFVEGACRTPLLYPPGSQLRYQSMGILLAAETVQRISKQPLPAFMKQHLFDPLGMRNSSLGLGGRTLDQTMKIQLPDASDWDWNSTYWRNLGSPWGGVLADTADVERLLQYFAQPDARVVKPETARAMVTNQVHGIPKRWGLGWMLNDGQLAKNGSHETFGHGGSTGTVCWLDPVNHVSLVLLTTKPAKDSNATLLKPVSDKVSAST